MQGNQTRPLPQELPSMRQMTTRNLAEDKLLQVEPRVGGGIQVSGVVWAFGQPQAVPRVRYSRAPSRSSDTLTKWIAHLPLARRASPRRI